MKDLEHNSEFQFDGTDKRYLIQALAPLFPYKIEEIIEQVLGGIHTLGLLEETLAHDTKEASPLVENDRFYPERCFLSSDPTIVPLLLDWTEKMLQSGSGITGRKNLLEAIDQAKQGERILGLGRHLELAAIPFMRLLFEKIGHGDFFDRQTIFITGQKLSSEQIVPSAIPDMIAERVKQKCLKATIKNIVSRQYPTLSAITEPRPLFPTLMGIVNQFRFFTKRDDIDNHKKSVYLRAIVEYIKQHHSWDRYRMLFLYPMAGCERGRPPDEVDENFVSMIFRGTPFTPPIDKVFLFNEGGEIARHPPDRGKNLLAIIPQVQQKRMTFGATMKPQELLEALQQYGFVSQEIKEEFISSRYKTRNKEIAIGIERAIRAMNLT